MYILNLLLAKKKKKREKKEERKERKRKEKEGEKEVIRNRCLEPADPNLNRKSMTTYSENLDQTHQPSGPQPPHLKGRKPPPTTENCWKD